MKFKKICSLIVALSCVMSTSAINANASEVKAEDEKLNNESTSSKIDSNNVLEENGVKITVTDITGSKDRIKANIKIEGDKITDDVSPEDYEMNAFFKDSPENGWSRSFDFDEKEKIINIECESRTDEEFAETGLFRVDFVMPYLKFNKSLEIPVDFTEDFKQTTEAQLNYKMNNREETIEKFVSNNLGTKVIISKPSSGNNRFDFIDMNNMSVVLKIDGKYYDTNRNHSGENDNVIYKEYINNDLKYNDIVNAKNISLIYTIDNFSREDFKSANKVYLNNRKNIATLDNIKYDEKFEFSDGSFATFKIEKENDKVKIYCTSDSHEKSVLLAMGLSGEFLSDPNDMDSYIGESKKVVYDDISDSNTVIAQFENDNPQYTLELNNYCYLYYFNKVEMSKEIKIK